MKKTLCAWLLLTSLAAAAPNDAYVDSVENWYRHDYSKDELAVWAKRIDDSGAKTVWAYFNNDREGYAIKNARTLSRLLRSRQNCISRSPHPVR